LIRGWCGERRRDRIRRCPRIVPPASKTRRWIRRYGLATFGASIILIWILIALFAPLISRYSPNIVDVAIRLQPPSAQHWLGTDALGRDVYARLVYGSQISLFTGFVVVIVAALVGTMLGGIAAYARGKLEEVIMRITDLVFCFPPIILALAIAAALGIGATNTIIAMLVVWWPKFAASRPQPHHRTALAGICGSRDGAGPEPGAHPGPSHHSELGRPAGRAGHARYRQRHHHLRGPVLSRSRGGAADAGMGLDGGRGP
jgi:hypothetical protein